MRRSTGGKSVSSVYLCPASSLRLVLLCVCLACILLFLNISYDLDQNESKKMYLAEEQKGPQQSSKAASISEVVTSQQRPQMTMKTPTPILPSSVNAASNVRDGSSTSVNKVSSSGYNSNMKMKYHPNGQHFILSLSEEELKTLTFDQMMEPYGEAQGGGSCADDFGNKLVNRWRGSKKTVCQRNEDISGPRSSIDCHLIKQTRHHGNGDNLCLLQNVQLDFGVFSNEKITNRTIKNYVDSKHWKLPYIKYPKGFLEANCIPVQKEWDRKYLPGWNAEVVFDPMQKVDELQCDEWVNHPVLLIQRDTFANFFHGSEDMVNAFLSLAILKWSQEHLQIYLTDLYPNGPFISIWNKVFAKSGLRLMTAWDLKSKYDSKVTNGKKSKVCFKNLATNIYGPASPITVASWNTPCKNTALVRAYADVIIRGLNFQSYTHAMQSKPLQTIKIVYLTRRSSGQWPERKYCGGNTFFDCQYWTDSNRKLSRTIKNDKDVIEALKTLESEKFKSKAKVIFEAIDYGVLDFEAQIKKDLEIDIMIGPHGAGLMHSIFMRDRAVLMEMFIDGSNGNRHFHNLANWAGKTYVGDVYSNPVNTKLLLKNVRKVIENINVEKF